MSKLISIAKFPITITYDGDKIVVSPGETLNIKNSELLPGALPNGLVLKKGA